PLRVVTELLPLIGSGGKIAVITSRMGSIAENSGGAWYAYRMSKAAVNAGFRSLSRDLRPRGIAVAVLHPGMVETDMLASVGAAGQGVTPEVSARGLLKRIDTLTLESTGTFWHGITGEEIPW